MKRRITPSMKQFLSAALSILMLCGNFVFSLLPVYAQDDDSTIYLQDLYTANPSSVTVVGSSIITEGYPANYSKGLRQDPGTEESSMTFSLTDLNLSSWGGDFVADCLMQYGAENAHLGGDVIFKVYIDGNLAAQSGVVTATNKDTLKCYIPGDAKTIRLATDCYDDTAYDWCWWGDPHIVPRKNPEGGSTIYFQDLYNANPRAVTVVGDTGVQATGVTIGFSTGNIEYKKALRHDPVDNKNGQEESSMTFSLTDLTLSPLGGYFVAECVMQIGDSSASPYSQGDVIFKVYIDGKLAAQSGVVSYQNSKVTLNCYIPGDAETIRLATDCYDDTAFDWCWWGDPRIVPREDKEVYLTSLLPTENNKVQTGYGSYELRYADTSSQVFTRSIYNHAGSPGAAFASVSYDVEYIAKNGAVFKSYIGFLKNNPGEDTNKYGRASFLVYADDVLLTCSEEITVDSPLTALEIYIPAGTKTLKLAQNPGTSQSCDWCLWGDPCIIPLEYKEVYLTSLSPTENNKVQTGYGSYELRYADTSSQVFTRSIYNHAGSPGAAFASVSYDVESIAKNGAVFKSYIGFLKNNPGEDTNKYGRALFLVYADDVLLTCSEEITVDSPLTALEIYIPAGTKTLKLAQDPGTSQSCDWCLWGDPYLAVDSDYPNRLASAALSAEKNELEVGETQQLSITATLKSGKSAPISEAVVTYESSNPEVLSVSEDGVVKALSGGSAVVTATVAYNESTATATLGFQNATLNVDNTGKLEMEGIQIRITARQGLRFIAKIDKSIDVLEYGIIALPEDLAEGILTLYSDRVAVVSSNKDDFKIYYEGDKYRYYTICVVNIPAKHYNRKISVRAYAICQDLNGNRSTVYSDIMTGDILSTAKGLTEEYPDNTTYSELYNNLNAEYEAATNSQMQ